MLELDLLAAGLLLRERDAEGRERLRLSDAGLQWLAASRQRLQGARSAHEALVARVALDMHRAGRIVWCGLSLRAPVQAASDETRSPTAASTSPPAHRWAVAMPDVYSVRHTTREDYLLPVVHEIKVSRADLLADLKRPAKGEAYRALGSECWYVLREGIAEPDDIPALYGVMEAALLPPAPGPPEANPRFGALTVLRPAPRRAFAPPFSLWMALARAAPLRFDDEPDPQAPLCLQDPAA